MAAVGAASGVGVGASSTDAPAAGGASAGPSCGARASTSVDGVSAALGLRLRDSHPMLVNLPADPASPAGPAAPARRAAYPSGTPSGVGVVTVAG